ncbi:MAG: type II toxin-antitoxin system Phd/YefM family antitoxin [bacterium]
MIKIGVRELKIHLSRYLRDIKDGKDILVTERGKAIAQIVPVRTSKNKKDIRPVLFEMAQKGYILLPQQWGKPVGPPHRVKIKGTSFSDAVIEDRR